MMNKKYPVYLTIVITTLALFTSQTSEGQVLRRLEQKVIQKVDRKVDQTIDKGLDKLDKTVSGGNADKKTESSKQEDSTPEPKQNKNEAPTQPTQAEPTTDSENQTADESDRFKHYDKFDFIPGENVIALDDYSQDDIGQPPLKWNFEGNAEVVNLNEQKWVALSGNYTKFYPDFIKSLPENFTLEFDAAVNEDYKGYGFNIFFLHRNPENYRSKNPFQDAPSLHPGGYLNLDLRPMYANNGKTGDFTYSFTYEGMKANSRNNNVPEFSRDINRKVRISIWRQNQRLRLYVDHTKVWDLPRAFAPGTEYNTLLFETKSQSPFYIGGLRLAEGRPDLRNKFIKEGTFSTSGIHFDLNSANVRPESYGLLKEIASVFQASPESKITIIGHTDSDGSEDLNQKLSLARATSVKNILAEQFGIKTDNFTVEGKGSSIPVADNTTAEGKASNRRVEFKKVD